MKLKKTLSALAASSLALSLAACSDDSDSDDGNDSANQDSDAAAGGGTNYITYQHSEPQNPLIPGNTNETGGGTPITYLYSNLTYLDAEGDHHNEVAESIDFDGDRTYTVKLKDWKWSDGTELTADHFVDAWNYTVSESLMLEDFMSPIKGYEEGVEELEGLTVDDDKTFTIELEEPVADFEVRLGYSAFSPLHPSAYDDIDAYGEKPITNGPYQLEEWNHDENLLLTPNPEYEGEREVQNDGIDFRIYSQLDAAYADLLSGNLDLLESIPESALTTYEDELDGRSVNQPSSVVQTFTIPQYLEHFDGEEGKLRRQAISMAFDREEIASTIFNDSVTPAKEFTSPVLPAFTEDLEGTEVTEFNPEKAKELWDEANDINEFSGRFELAYNADGGHAPWVDALTNQLSNNLEIDAIGAPYPDFKGLRDEITSESIETAFRSGWMGMYPSPSYYLEGQYVSNAPSNDGNYSNEELDAKVAEAARAEDIDEANEMYNEAQEILLQDLPQIPMWYSNTNAGYSDKVDNVTFGWNRVPMFHEITKS